MAALDAQRFLKTNSNFNQGKILRFITKCQPSLTSADLSRLSKGPYEEAKAREEAEKKRRAE